MLALKAKVFHVKRFVQGGKVQEKKIQNNLSTKSFDYAVRGFATGSSHGRTYIGSLMSQPCFVKPFPIT